MTAYWHRYFDQITVDRITTLVTTHRLASTGVDLHLDLYRQPRADAPVLIVNHGGGGHAGLFAGLALALFDQGFTVIVPDQKGQGRSGGVMGDFTIAEAVQNIVDVARWAAAQFTGPLCLAGGSIGGGLTYYAAAALARQGTPPRAILCLNLYDFGDPRTGLSFTHLAPLARIPGVAPSMAGLFRLLARMAPRLRLPYRPLARFREMTDRRDQASRFYEKWRADPQVLRSVTARYMASIMGTPPAIPFEENLVPVLVVNQLRDRMVAPALTRTGFDHLGGPRRYAEIDWGHFSLDPAFTRELVDLGTAWFQEWQER